MSFWSKKEPKPSLYTLGYSGTAETVHETALFDCGYDHKLPLLAGCLQAFNEGRPENLRSFVSGYLEFKRGKGAVAALHEEGMDNGIVHLVAQPVMMLIEKNADPAATLASLTEGMSDFYKQTLLDVTLRNAVMEGGWSAVACVLDAGADPNCGQGRVIYNAVNKQHTRIAALLQRYGGDFTIVPTYAEAGYAQKLAATLKRLEKTDGNGRIKRAASSVADGRDPTEDTTADSSPPAADPVTPGNGKKNRGSLDL